MTKQKKLLLLAILLLLAMFVLVLFPSVSAFTYDDVVDFFAGLVGSYHTFITGDVVGTLGNDADNDGVPDNQDNCVYTPNGPQLGTCFGGSKAGQSCNFGSKNICPSNCYMNQEDFDFDSVGNVCDNCYDDPNGPTLGTCLSGPSAKQRCDATGASQGLASNICPVVCSMNQEDYDNNGEGDACDSQYKDSDYDGVADPVDNCPTTFNPPQTDTDGDGIGDACDSCIYAANDGDGDGFVNVNCGGPDCDDNDANIFPGAPEDCEDGLDNNCDGNIDATDPICATGYGSQFKSKYRGTPPGQATPVPPQPKIEKPLAEATKEGKLGDIEKLNLEMQQKLIIILENLNPLINWYREQGAYSKSKEFIEIRVSINYIIRQSQDADKNIKEGKYDASLEPLLGRVNDIADNLDAIIILLEETL